jgi:serine/threonine protein kinase
MSIPNIPGYRIVSSLSESKRARVYLAEQTSLQRLVALKILSGEVNIDSASRARVIDEGKLAARLTHPNLLSVFDIGMFEEQHYIATEHVSGGSLRDAMQAGALSPEKALKVTRDLATGLAFLHQNGFLHRDVKPTNVLFRDDQTALLSEAGVSRATSAKTPENEQIAFGSPHYMSPERAQAQASDHRSDIYSLGVVLFEMLVGATPFDADDPFQVAIKHINEPVPTLPPHLADLQPLVHRALAKLPAERYSSATELVLGLDAALAARGIVLQTGQLPAVKMPALAPNSAAERAPPPSAKPPVSMQAPMQPPIQSPSTEDLAATAQMPLPVIPEAHQRGVPTEVVDPVPAPPPRHVPSSNAPPIPAQTMLGRAVPTGPAPSARAPAASPPLAAAPIPQSLQYTQPVQPFTPPAGHGQAVPNSGQNHVGQNAMSANDGAGGQAAKSKVGLLLLVLGVLGLLAIVGAVWWVKKGSASDASKSAPQSTSAPVVVATAPTPAPGAAPTIETTPRQVSPQQSGAERMLELAQQAELAGDLVTPADGCAVFYYREVLKFDASNETALLGIDAVANAVQADIERFAGEGKLVSAQGLADAAIAQFPDNDAIKALRQKLAN